MFRNNYPITVSMVSDHYDVVTEVFYKVKPHKDAFIGVVLLEDSFSLESAGDIFVSLELGEKLTFLVDGKSKSSCPAILVYRYDGTYLGQLPFSACLIPNMLIEMGVKVWGYFEAKSFTGGLLSIAVSIYCEKY